jgi:hypothetical protein
VRTDAVKARTRADDAEDEARRLEGLATEAESLANAAKGKDKKLRATADESGKAAPGVGTTTDPADDAARAPVPSAANGRPLDTPPDP